MVQPRQALQAKKNAVAAERGVLPLQPLLLSWRKNTGGESLEPRANDEGCARLRIEAGCAGEIHALDPTSVAVQAQKTRGARTAPTRLL